MQQHDLLLTIWNVDASRDAAAAEHEHIERREVGSQELVLLVRRGPRQQRQEVLGLVDQLGELGRHRLVDARDEALELAAHAERIAIALDEADVADKKKNNTTKL